MAQEITFERVAWVVPSIDRYPRVKLHTCTVAPPKKSQKNIRCYWSILIWYFCRGFLLVVQPWMVHEIFYLSNRPACVTPGEVASEC